MTRGYCVVTHTHGSDSYIGGFATRVVSPVKSSSILSMAARTPNGAPPHRKKGNAKYKIEEKTK
jgi:hypothetical protein